MSVIQVILRYIKVLVDSVLVWVLLAESDSMHQGKFPPGTAVKPTDCVRCNFCRRVFSIPDLELAMFVPRLLTIRYSDAGYHRHEWAGPERYTFPSAEAHEALQPVPEFIAAVFGERAGGT